MGLSTFRAGQNLHFFRAGVSPTWEDPWNEKVRFRSARGFRGGMGELTTCGLAGWSSYHLS